MATAPTPWDWIQGLWGQLQSSPAAIPLPSMFPAPAGSSASYTGAYGVGQGAQGGTPTAPTPFTAPSGTAGGLSPDERDELTTPVYGPPAPVYGQPQPGLGGNLRNGTGELVNPPTNVVNQNGGGPAYPHANTNSTGQVVALDANGNLNAAFVPASTALANGMTPEQMEELGYTQNADGNWVLERYVDPSGNPTLPGTPGATVVGAKPNRWYGANNYRVGGGARAPIYMSDFQTQQAYDTWARRKKLEAKEEDDGNGLRNTAAGASFSVGTG